MRTDAVSEPMFVTKSGLRHVGVRGECEGDSSSPPMSGSSEGARACVDCPAAATDPGKRTALPPKLGLLSPPDGLAGPITSSTMCERSSEDARSGSTSAERGGGQTASWKIEPDSEVRIPMRCGEYETRPWSAKGAGGTRGAPWREPAL